jgi:hypothetical protein
MPHRKNGHTNEPVMAHTRTYNAREEGGPVPVETATFRPSASRKQSRRAQSERRRFNDVWNENPGLIMGASFLLGLVISSWTCSSLKTRTNQ